jgi:hypothetical protein
MARKGRWVAIARACGDRLARTPAGQTNRTGTPFEIYMKSNRLVRRDAEGLHARISQISPGEIPVGSLMIAYPPGHGLGINQEVKSVKCHSCDECCGA